MEHIKKYAHLYAVAVVNFLIIYLTIFNRQYGYFIDEFYYIACANNPAAGYVDHPPLAPLLLTFWQFFFGDSIYSLRVLPALAVASTSFLTGYFTLLIGGNRYAQIIAALCYMSAPIMLAFGSFYSMNPFEPLLMIIILIIVLKIIRTGDTKLWIRAGALTGLGIMNKHTFVISAAFLFAALLISSHRKLLFSKWLGAGILIAFIIVIPNLLWQYFNGFPSLEFYSNITKYKNVPTPPLEFIKAQIMFFSPVIFPVWFAGLIRYFVSKDLKEYRFAAYFFILSFGFMLLSATSRPDRLSFAYPVVFAAGGMAVSALMTKIKIKWLKPVPAVIIVSGILLAVPLILPYLSPEAAYKATKSLGFNTELEKGKAPLISQIIADRIGWEDKVKMVRAAYSTLSEDEKKRVVFGASNYGQAGAIELFAGDIANNITVCSHNNYYLWSLERIKGKDVLIQIDNLEDIHGYREAFDSVAVYPALYTNKWVSPHEDSLAVFILRKSKYPFEHLLRESKHFY